MACRSVRGSAGHAAQRSGPSSREFCAEMQGNLIGWPESIERYLDLIGIFAARRR
jgi:hypothetical protein